MYLGDENTKRRTNIIRGISIALIVLFFVFFWQEISTIVGLGLKFLKGVVLGNLRLDELIPQADWRSIWILAFNLSLGFLMVFFSWLLMLAGQAVLPVEGFVDTYRTAWHLLLFMLRMHGPAVFVKDGINNSTKEDERKGPGVAVVDFNSAIVLEERVPAPGFGRLIAGVVQTILEVLGLAEHAEKTRVAGPGIVFMSTGEKIRGAVDMRTQFRSIPGITAYTRDGIEVNTRIWALFNINQKADKLDVTYDGEPLAKNLRVVTLEALLQNKQRVTGMSDELDENDRDEIHRYIHFWKQHEAEQFPYGPPDDPPEDKLDRIFAAVFSEARDEKGKLIPWTDLPVRVAAGYFREMLTKINYDQLYNVGGEQEEFPIPRYKTQLKFLMRNNGILSFRLVFHNSLSQSLQKRKDYNESELLVSKVHRLKYPKMLRDRGIKVTMAGFGDILPVNEKLYQHRLQVWQSTWKHETDLINAKREFEATQLRNHARAQAQQELLVSLNDILQNQSISREVMAVRILQAFENMAVESKTLNMLPMGTLDILKSTRDWLLPGANPPAPRPENDRPAEGRMP